MSLLSVRPDSREFIKYAVASSAALLVDVAVLTCLVNGGWPYLLAASASFITGGICLYTLSVKLVFRFRQLPNPALELPLFIALGLVGLAVNGVVMFLVVSTCHVSYLAGKGAASICTFSVNYLLRRNTMFARAWRGGHRTCVLAE